jgi:hypothetical protein
VELNSIDGCVVVDRTGVRGAPAQRLAVGFARSSDVLAGDRREVDKLDRVDLDLTVADPVAAAPFDPWLLPQSHRERDVSGQNVVAQLAAELHARDASTDRRLLLLSGRRASVIASATIRRWRIAARRKA